MHANDVHIMLTYTCVHFVPKTHSHILKAISLLAYGVSYACVIIFHLLSNDI